MPKRRGSISQRFGSVGVFPGYITFHVLSLTDWENDEKTYVLPRIALRYSCRARSRRVRLITKVGILLLRRRPAVTCLLLSATEPQTIPMPNIRKP